MVRVGRGVGERVLRHDRLCEGEKRQLGMVEEMGLRRSELETRSVQQVVRAAPSELPCPVQTA